MQKKRATIFIAALTLILVFGLALWNPMQTAQMRISDLFFRGHTISQDITIIAIDDKSLIQLGRFQDWPRGYHAQMLRTLKGSSPAVVAIDLDFSSKSKELTIPRLQQIAKQGSFADLNSLVTALSNGAHPEDQDLQSAIDESGPVTLVSLLSFRTKASQTAGTFPEVSGQVAPIFKGSNVTLGYTDVFYDRDGILRRFKPQAGEFKSFGKAIAEAYKKSPIETGDNQQLIAYAGRPFSYPILSYVDVAQGKFDPKLIKDKIVLIGVTSPSMQDIHSTPTSRIGMPGVEVHANIIQQLLSGRKLTEQGTLSLLFYLIIIVALGTVIFLRANLSALAVIGAAGVIFFPLTAYAFYQRGFIANVIYPEIAWIVCALSCLWYRNKTEFRARAEIRRAFSHYVSPVVVSELLKNPSTLKLGGKRQQISVLFSDIVGFTTFSEKLSPEDTVAVLNNYLTAMTEVVFNYYGTLDKYQGDAIMALFGAPMVDEHHAINACHTALAMRRALTSLHEKWGAIPNLPFKDELLALDFRVGISTGPAVIGNVGSEKRFDYTAIGDIVNLGSRLESVNRKYGTRVIVDKATFVAVTNNHNPFAFRKLDTVRVKGRRQETEIFELVSPGESLTDEMRSMLDDFENGRILYTQRNFIEARQYFEAALRRFPDDGPAHIYLNRCAFFMRKPPSREWDAVVELQEK